MPAITTLASLRAAAADALVRGDFTDRIANAVPLAEAWLNRNLRLRMMQTDEALTATQGSRTMALPAGFLEPIALFRLDADGRRALPYRPDLTGGEAAATTPQAWSIAGADIVFSAPSDAAQGFTLRMLKRLALDGEEASNALLDAWPDLYLTALLTVVAGVHLTDDPRLTAWKAARDELLGEVLRKEARSRSLATLVADAAFRQPSRTFEDSSCA